MDQEKKTVAVIVAHPDDETLWAGGTILSHPLWQCFIVCLCRKSDPDRAPKFAKAIHALGAKGVMGDLDDGPEQIPLNTVEIAQTILQLLPVRHFDLVITHHPDGEYTRHRRHEEVSKAVIELWHRYQLLTNELWLFAYEDGLRTYYPKPLKNTPVYIGLPQQLWNLKYNIVTQIYGFEANGWEAKTTPVAEAFWQFFNAADAQQLLIKNH